MVGGLVWGIVGQIKVREMRRKRYESPSDVLDRRPFADRDGSAALVRRRTGRSSVYKVRVGERPVGHPASVSSGWDSLGLVSGGWCFPNCQRCSSRGRTGRTLFGHDESCFPQARPRGAQECCGQA